MSSERASVQAEPEAAPQPAVEPETKVEPETEVAPAPEPIAEPVPAPEPAPEVAPEPKPGKTRRKPKTPREPEPAPAVEEPCTDVASEAKAASRDKQWSRVLKLTKSSRCWDDDKIRRRVRAKALMETGRLADCVELGSADPDADVRRVATLCAMQLEKAGTP